DEFFALGAELEKEENYLVNADGTKTKRALFTYQGIYPGYLEEVLFPAIACAGGMEAIDKMCAYEEGSFNNPTVIGVLDMFQKISKDGLLMKGTVALNHTQSQTDMMMGKSLFIVNGNWMEGEMKESPREEGFEFGMMAPPVFKKGDTRYLLSSYEQFEIPAKAKNPELAKEFLKFLYTKESVELFAQKAGGVYALKDAAETAKPFITSGVYNTFSVMESAKVMMLGWDPLPKGCKIVVYPEIFENCVTPVMNGTMTTTQWAQSVEKAFAQIRADQAAAK
ncbi:MAG: extracellular solute-binding protein, partial [Oscillospiraceae bacterium]